MESFTQNYRSLGKYWWALLLLGIASVIAGIFVFVYPATSFKTLAVVFAVMMLVSGILEIIIAFSEKYLPGRGWMVIGGTIESVLGLVLLLNPSLSLAVLPLLLAFWLLLHGLSTIGFAADLRALKVSGMGWSIFLGILLIICGIAILFTPTAGVKLIIVILGAGLLAAGFGISALAIDIYGIRRSYLRSR